MNRMDGSMYFADGLMCLFSRCSPISSVRQKRSNTRKYSRGDRYDSTPNHTIRLRIHPMRNKSPLSKQTCFFAIGRLLQGDIFSASFSILIHWRILPGGTLAASLQLCNLYSCGRSLGASVTHRGSLTPREHCCRPGVGPSGRVYPWDRLSSEPLARVETALSSVRDIPNTRSLAVRRKCV